MQRTRLRTAVASGLGAMFVVGAVVPTVSAQDDTSLALAEGEYTGSVDFSGGFGAVFVADGGVFNVFLDGRLNGPASMTVRQGEVSGTWSMSGTSTTNGVLSASGDGVTVDFIVEGQGTYDGQGQFEGVADDARMVGILGGTSTVTVSSDFFTQTSSDDEPSEVDLTLTDPIDDCGRAFARLDLDLNQSIEEIPGFSSAIIGLFSGADPEGNDLYISELELIATRVAELWNRVPDSNEDGLGLLVDAFALLRDIEALEDNWDFSSCRSKPNFANAMTLLAASLIERLLSDIENDAVDDQEALVLIDKGLELGLRTGALGSGTVLQARAMAIAARTEAALGEIFDRATTGSEPSTFLAQESAFLAEQFGWELTNSAGVTSLDLLITQGAAE